VIIVQLEGTLAIATKTTQYALKTPVKMMDCALHALLCIIVQKKAKSSNGRSML
jgi:hypothetical protein